MKKLIAAALMAVMFTAGMASARNISGAGASFPAPLYQKWAEGYRAKTGIGLNYQSIGSGGGIRQIKSKTVDFGATDKPLSVAELDAAGLYQFPTVIGGVVPNINLPGVQAGVLKLTPEVLAGIFLGKIKKWNDPAIVKLNPGVKLMPLTITVVHRSDGSGTTFVFTDYLAKVSPEWKSKVGASDSVAWPTGLGGKGNDGVAAFVKQTIGSIGYVEYSYAVKTGQSYALLRNAAGQYPKASLESFAAAVAGVDWNKAPGNYVITTNAQGAGAWPIASPTFILVHKKQMNAEIGASVLKFFDYAYAFGDAPARDMVYVPLPHATKNVFRKQWARNITANGKPVYVSTAK